MSSDEEDDLIVSFLYDFVDYYRRSIKPYHTAAVIFKAPELHHEHRFDELLWERLLSLHEIDRQRFAHDPRVDSDPTSAHYSYSLKEEAFFIVGLNPMSNRMARQFRYPAIVFNPHAEFEKLRNKHKYEPMKTAVRKRDVHFSGSVNPMLKDFGEESEVFQYSGLQYDLTWQCPLKNSLNHDPHATDPHKAYIPHYYSRTKGNSVHAKKR
jgi:FPC/CPF motif-containing protein YcgG